MAIVRRPPDYKELTEILISSVRLDKEGVQIYENKQALYDEYERIERVTAVRVVYDLLSYLYDSDFSMLQIDMTKIALFDVEQVEGAERVTILNKLWNSISPYYGGNDATFLKQMELEGVLRGERNACYFHKPSTKK